MIYIKKIIRFMVAVVLYIVLGLVQVVGMCLAYPMEWLKRDPDYAMTKREIEVLSAIDKDWIRFK